MHLPPAYTPYACPPTQAVCPPYSVENSSRNYNYPTGSVQFDRGVTFDTFDTDTEGVRGAEECREENVINEEGDIKASTGSIPKSAERNEESIESETKVFTAPDSLLEEWFLELADAMTRFPSPSGKN
jgi:hypothetical protein